MPAGNPSPLPGPARRPSRGRPTRPRQRQLVDAPPTGTNDHQATRLPTPQTSTRRPTRGGRGRPDATTTTVNGNNADPHPDATRQRPAGRGTSTGWRCPVTGRSTRARVTAPATRPRRTPERVPHRARGGPTLQQLHRPVLARPPARLQAAAPRPRPTGRARPLRCTQPDLAGTARSWQRGYVAYPPTVPISCNYGQVAPLTGGPSLVGLGPLVARPLGDYFCSALFICPCFGGIFYIVCYARSDRPSGLRSVARPAYCFARYRRRGGSPLPFGLLAPHRTFWS